MTNLDLVSGDVPKTALTLASRVVTVLTVIIDSFYISTRSLFIQLLLIQQTVNYKLHLSKRTSQNTISLQYVIVTKKKLNSVRALTVRLFAINMVTLMHQGALSTR